jgi:hypothetical protein
MTNTLEALVTEHSRAGEYFESYDAADDLITSSPFVLP